MKKKYVAALGVLLGIFSVSYFYFNILDRQFMSNLFAPGTAFLSALLIFMLVKENPLQNRAGWLLLAFVCLNWGIADALWFILEYIIKIDPMHYAPLNYLYAVSNILLLSAGLYYFIKHLKQWHLPQLIADAVVSWLVIVTMMTDSILLHFNLASLTVHEIVTTGIYVVTDVTAFVLLLTLVSSTRVNKLSLRFKFILAGYLLFIVTDLSYVYASALNTYQTNAIIDSLYILSMACFGIAALLSFYVPQAFFSQPAFSKNPQNMGAPNRLLLFLIVPILMYAFGYLEFSILLMCIVIMIMYRFVSGYIQASLKNELLLKEMTLLNEQLEEIVDKRTEALRKANYLLEQSSYTDSLTQMSNRHSFIKRVDELISQKTIFSVFYMDFNHFKIINDLHGHEMGDRVLQEISRRFFKLQSKSKVFFRLGGDEFAIIFIHQADNMIDITKENKIMCQELYELANNRMEFDGYIFQIGISVGTATYPFDAENGETLVRYADLAMYNAKKSLETPPCVAYSSQYNEIAENRKRIEFLLRTIDYDKEFSLVFQPQVDITTGSAVAAEALLRWNNQEFCVLSPTEFLEIAAETDLIVKIGKWVIDRAFSQIAQWNNRHNNRHFKICINLSPLQFSSTGLPAYIRQKSQEYGVQAEWVIFEITETHALNRNAIVQETFSSLSEMGFRFSVDNYGSGYSSLTYLTTFQIKQLKISKELIRNINTKKDDLFIIKAIIFLAQGIDMEVIAEGVDSPEQLETLRQLGCRIVQGNLYSAPLHSDEFEAKYLPGGYVVIK